MKRDKQSILSIDRKKYVRAMAENLPVLRAKLGVSQEEMADMIGVTRVTLSSAERGARELSWTNFVSLLFIFTQNEETLPLLTVLGVYTPELASLFKTTNLSRFRNNTQQ